jgi:hypothetical protein
MKLAGPTLAQAAVVVNLAAAAFPRATPPARLVELATRPDALALAPELAPGNVVAFRPR